MVETFPSILCVDDDTEVLERLKEFFTLKGFIVLTATNGVEACLQVKRWAPRAVILDLFIPRLGGIGALGRIHAIDPTLPVIMTTDSGEGLAMVANAGLGVTATFAKPLDLPCIAQALARAGVTAPAELAEDETSQRPAPRVLVVDDEREFREVLLEYLGSKGFEAREASSGEEAVERVAEFDPHIVLLDLMMAGMGGMDTLREIRHIAPRACVIMVTAAHDLDAARGALARGAADYVTKPFPFRYLDAVLDVHLPLDAELSRA
jgi:DNA-binding response OmpR family regulator